MWTLRTEPTSTILPEPNHFVVLVPRLWSTGISRLPEPADTIPPVTEVPTAVVGPPTDVDQVPVEIHKVPTAEKVQNETSFNIENRDNQPPDAIVEPDVLGDDGVIVDSLPDDITTDEYVVIEGGTKRDKPKLVDSRGYTYNVKKR